MRATSLLTATLLLGATVSAQQATGPRPDVPAPEGFRSNRTSYSALMDVLGPTRGEVTDAQLDQLKGLTMEAIWSALGDYRWNYEDGFISSQPGERIVGRAVTLRYVPPRPDVVQALETLAEEGDWPARFYARAAEESSPNDVIVVDLGGANGNQLFGDMGALGIKLTGASGVIINGGTRDQNELQREEFKGFPVMVKFFDIKVSSWYGLDYNAPIRIGNAIVLPGDVVVADESGMVFFPPEMVETVLERAAETVAVEAHERELMRGRQHRFRDVYPLSPELREEWERSQRPPDR